MPAQTTVPILHKTVRLLAILAGNCEPRSIQQLANAAGMATTSCFRVLSTLEQERWIIRPGAGHVGYRLGMGLLPLLASLRNHQRLFERSGPGLQRLADHTGMGVKLSIREGAEAVTVQRAEPADAVAVTNPVGSRFGVVLGSTGAALLAGLDAATLSRVIERSPAEAWRRQTPDDLRRRVHHCVDQGYCFDRGSYHPQLGGLSAPIRHPELSLAVTITGMLSDLEEIKVEETLVLLCAVQRELSELEVDAEAMSVPEGPR